MTEFLRARSLFASPLLRITDVSCRAPACARGAEECASSHHVVFARAGVFVTHVGRRRVVADPAHVLFFNHRESFRVSHPAEGGDECTMVSGPASTWMELGCRYDGSIIERPDTPFALPVAPLRESTLLRFRQLRHAARVGVAEEAELEEEALECLDAVLRDAYSTRGARRSGVRQRTAHERRELAARTAIMIAADPTQGRSLLELAQTVNASPFHLARIFREHVGIPIHQYRLRLRLALALDRLLDRGESLSTTAHTLGFSSHSHFTTRFRRTFGLSPSAFRRSASRARVAELRTKHPRLGFREEILE